jgi:antirestriction protein ArdC
MSAKEKQQAILDELVSGLELGEIPWQTPCFSEMPQNILGRKYNGINVLYLMWIAKKKQYTRNIWGTFNQIKTAGGSVNAGAKSVPIVHWSILEKEVVSKHGKTEKQDIPILKYFNVFNIAGQTNLKLPDKQASTFSPVEKAEEIIKNNNPSIVVSVSGNYYVPSTDTIHIQRPETFYNPNDYYQVLWHECGHWTGHESRLNRPLASLNKDKHSYSTEELIAEISSSFLMNELGLETNKINTQAYINGWSSFLKDQKQELIKASSKASKVVEYLLKTK